MSTLLVMNVITGEEALLCTEKDRWIADELVQNLRRDGRAKGETAPDAWTVIELSHNSERDPSSGGGEKDHGQQQPPEGD